MKKYLQFVGALIILLAAGYIFLVHTVMPKYIKQAIPQMQQLATKYINGSVSIGGLKWEGGLTAELTDVVVKDAKGEKVAELPRPMTGSWIWSSKPGWWCTVAMSAPPTDRPHRPRWVTRRRSSRS